MTCNGPHAYDDKKRLNRQGGGILCGRWEGKVLYTGAKCFLHHAFQREEARNDMPIDGVAFDADMNERTSANCQKISLLFSKERKHLSESEIIFHPNKTEGPAAAG